jgi:hypothetical protein
VGITFSRLAFSYWIDYLGFLLREKLAAIFITPYSWGFPIGRSFTRLHQAISGAVAGEEEDFCKGSFARTSFTLF